MKSRLTILCIMCFIEMLQAQVPEKISYQAIIRNHDNELVKNTQVSMRISILKGSTTGTIVYTETQTPTTNANGLVSIQFGGEGGFNVIDWSNGSYFIKTETDISGGTNYSIEGVSQLLSVPYALYAKTSGSSTPGQKGETGSVPKHEWNDTSLRFENQDGSWGEFVDLIGVEGRQGIQGEKGDKGEKGDNGGQAGPDNNGIGFITSTTGFVYENGNWYSQSLVGNSPKIISTNKKIGIMTNTRGYVYENGIWHEPLVLVGSPQKFFGDNGVIGIVTNTTGYAFNNNQWYQQLFVGQVHEILIHQGLICVRAGTSAYVFSTNQWYQQSLVGTERKTFAKDGKIVIFSGTLVYVFDKTTNQWYQQSYVGTPIEYED